MKIAKSALLVPMLSGLIWLSSSAVPVAAEPARTMQVEVTNYSVSAEYLPVGDEQGHVVSLGKKEGVAEFPNGENAKNFVVYTLDTRRTGGISTVYVRFVFDDGSTIFCACTEEITMAKDLIAKRGEGTITKGTGRFADLKGTFTLAGTMKPVSQDPKLTAVTTYYFTLE